MPSSAGRRGADLDAGDLLHGEDHGRDVLTAVPEAGGFEIALLGNHGVLVLASTISLAYLRATVIEYRSRLAWRVEALGGGQSS